jgi:predicted ATPase
MPDEPEHDFGAIKLDPDLLPTPFRIQTNWHVITGAPSCGKTTLVDQLADQGFQTVPETAHLYLEREMAKGRTIYEMRANMAAVQRRLIDKMREVEHGLQANDFLFLDRAFPDTLAFCRAYGLNPNEFLVDCFHYRYDSVFILDPLPFQENGTRDDDAARVDFMD